MSFALLIVFDGVHLFLFFCLFVKECDASPSLTYQVVLRLSSFDNDYCDAIVEAAEGQSMSDSLSNLVATDNRLLLTVKGLVELLRSEEPLSAVDLKERLGLADPKKKKTGTKVLEILDNIPGVIMSGGSNQGQKGKKKSIGFNEAELLRLAATYNESACDVITSLERGDVRGFFSLQTAMEDKEKEKQLNNETDSKAVSEAANMMLHEVVNGNFAERDMYSCSQGVAPA